MKMKLGLIVASVLAVTLTFAQAPVATIPFELCGDHIFIKVNVNGSKDLDYIFDTGDGLAILDINRAAELGISAGHDEVITSAEGSISGKRVKHNEFLIGSAPIHDVELHETDLSHLEISIGRDIDGIIGYDLLKNYVVELNYDTQEIKLFNPSGYSYMGTGKSYTIKMAADKNPHITASVKLANGETVSGEFYVDTGAKTTVDFNSPFVEAKGLSGKVGKSYVYLVAGLGAKEYEHHRGKVNNFSMGDITLEDMPVGLSHGKHGIQSSKKVAGIIGGGLLKKFNIVMDYQKKKMYLEANSSFGEPFDIDASGLELQLAKDKKTVLVHKVFNDSPAAAAGIKTNAVLNKVNGMDASEIGLAKLRSMLCASGDKVELVIDGKDVSLELKAML